MKNFEDGEGVRAALLIPVVVLAIGLGMYIRRETREDWCGRFAVVDQRDQLARDRISSLGQRAGWYERQVNEHERRLDELADQVDELMRSRACSPAVTR